MKDNFGLGRSLELIGSPLICVAWAPSGASGFLRMVALAWKAGPCWRGTVVISCEPRRYQEAPGHNGKDSLGSCWIPSECGVGIKGELVS